MALDVEVVETPAIVVALKELIGGSEDAGLFQWCKKREPLKPQVPPLNGDVDDDFFDLPPSIQRPLKSLEKLLTDQKDSLRSFRNKWSNLRVKNSKLNEKLNSKILSLKAEVDTYELDEGDDCGSARSENEQVEESCRSGSSSSEGEWSSSSEEEGAPPPQRKRTAKKWTKVQKDPCVFTLANWEGENATKAKKLL
jgi:hypothetical protein